MFQELTRCTEESWVTVSTDNRQTWHLAVLPSITLCTLAHIGQTRHWVVCARWAGLEVRSSLVGTVVTWGTKFCPVFVDTVITLGAVVAGGGTSMVSVGAIWTEQMLWRSWGAVRARWADVSCNSIVRRWWTCPCCAVETLGAVSWYSR